MFEISRNGCWKMVLAAGLLAGPAVWEAVRGQEANVGEAATARPTVRVFEIRDMVVAVSDSEPMYDFGLSLMRETPGQPLGGTGGLFSDGGGSVMTRDDRVKEVVDTIKTTVAPESWRDAGGTIGSIRELNGQLIINQTPENQVAIQNLLTQLRSARSLQVQVEERVVAVDQKTLEAVTAMGPLISVKQAAGITSENAKAKLLAAPRVLMFSGHSGQVMNSSDRSFVLGYRQAAGGENGAASQPAGGAGGSVEPIVERMRTGSALYVRATAAEDRSRVVVEFRHTIAKPKLNAAKTVPGLGGEKIAGGQSPQVDSTDLVGNFSIPEGMVAVVGGDRMEAEGVEGGEPMFALYLLRATIVPEGPAAGAGAGGRAPATAPRP